MKKSKPATALKVALCAVAVIAVTTISVTTLSYALAPKNNQKEFGMVNPSANGVLGERQNSIDVLFVGDSEAFSTFSPMQMYEEQGFTSYVCATSGQNLAYGNTLLHRALRTQSPRVVVIETNSIYASFSSEDAALRMLQDAIPLFEYHDQWKGFKMENAFSSITYTWTDDLKGFQINKNVDAADASGHMAPSEQVQEIPLLNRQYLQAMIDYCRAQGATPVLVSTPSTINWNTARHNGISEFATQAGVDYIDLNTEPTKVAIDWQTDTTDKGDHLNYKGAVKTSTYLGTLLKDRFNLANHGGDQDYSSWDESLQRYKRQVE